MYIGALAVLLANAYLVMLPRHYDFMRMPCYKLLQNTDL